ncbi:MAG: cyclic nucleotide-binding domain-containing protein [Bdellovibrionales bacterium]|nr:cyclic nucleotide-binding domain-containing protein [Bdellovibrionales bacterium]
MSSAAAKNPWTPEALIALFKGFSLLEKFPDHLIAELAAASEILDLPANTQILQQGQLNEHLYFLVSGTVGVYVDGGRVSKMQRKGDLLGEMSVISNKTVGATILSEGPVTLVRVDSRVFLDMKGPERDLYLSILYRIYATVLAEKLHETNQKAKHFEELTVQLTATQQELEEANQTLERKVEERTQRLEQQNAELMAGKNKMEDLLNNKRFLFQKLSAFQSGNLIPLKTFLDEMRKKFPEAEVVAEARTVVYDVQQVLGPLTDQYSSEQAVQGKTVLLADSNKKQQVIAKMALGGTGVVLDMVATLEEGKEKILNKNYDLVMFDAPMLELGNVAHAKDPSTKTVLITSDQIPNYLPALKMLKATPHIVSRDEADRTFTVKNIVTTVTKLLSRDLFGLEKYLSWGVDIQSRQIVGSRQRATLLQDVDTYFEKLGVRRANRDRMRTVLEEILMNAIYDAPTDKEGKSLYNHLPRTTELSLMPEEQSLLRFATDGMLVAVSVQDPFGSLKGGTILRYLEHNYAGSAGDLNAHENKGGAGRGLHQIVENADLVVFNVEPGKKTEVIALFNVEVKEKTTQNSFHLFILSKP